MESLLLGICLLLCVSLVHGQCDIAECKKGSDSLFSFTACSEYTQRIECLSRLFDSCKGQAGMSEIGYAMRAMHRPSDCVSSMDGMAKSMTAQSKMMTSVMKKSPPHPAMTFFQGGSGQSTGSVQSTGSSQSTGSFLSGLFPSMGMMPPMMGPMMGEEMGEMEMEGPEIGEGPMEMLEDMMEGEGGMFMPGMAGMFPGMFGGMGSGGAAGEGSEGAGSSVAMSPGMMSSGEGGAARFVDYRNAADGTKAVTAQIIGTTLFAILLSLL